MSCSKCGTTVDTDAKFCSKCGNSLMGRHCSKCGEMTKQGARFCHSCGQSTGNSRKEAVAGIQPGTETPGHRSWLSSFGTFLFIPIFAGIIVLLFWVNRDPGLVNASNSGQAVGDEQSMAVMGQVHETLERLKGNLEANPADLVAMDSLAIMYSIAGSFDKARTFYERHLEIEPDNKDIKIALALTLQNLERNDEALALIAAVLEKEPTYTFALHYFAEIHAKLGHKDMAEKAWQTIVDNYAGTEWEKIANQRIHELSHDE